ncbi:12117_t:CDS:2, partial [Ambispora gerdemannii]
MLLSDFSVEILVDGEPLTEYSAENSSVLTTGNSFYYKKPEYRVLEKSTQNYYVAIPSPGTQFTVRLSAACATQEEPIMAFLYVDRINDFTHIALTDKGSKIKQYFWNDERDVKYALQFGKYRYPLEPPPDPNLPIYTPTHIPGKKMRATSRVLPHNNVQGALGTISVYFYRARQVSRMVDIPPFRIKSSNITEAHRTKEGISEQIGFKPFDLETREMVPILCQLEAIDDHAIVALHIHYRSREWLMEHNIIQMQPIPEILSAMAPPSFRISLKRPAPKSDEALQD